MRWLRSLAISLCALLSTRAALASPTYPAEIEAHLALSSAPACGLCHAGGVTGYGTVTTPFGAAMRARGLVAQDLTALDAALDQLNKDAVDSDGDGVPDVEELVMGTDPNSKGGSAAAGQPPDLTYGCAATLAPRGPGSSGVALGLTAFAIAIAWARRRRRRLGAGAAAGAALILGGCYEVSYVGTDVCPSGLEWTGGDTGSPNMHPGRACIDCHTQNDGPHFTFAGTVFGASEPDDCLGAKGARIVITGADGKSIAIDANEAGNFYSRLSVAMPYRAMVEVGDKKNVMAAEQTSGDCNGCHTEKGKNNAPGRIMTPP